MSAQNSPALSLVQQAITALQHNNIERSEVLLLQAIGIDETNASALQSLGAVRSAQGRDLEALELYRKSLLVDAAQPDVYHNLGSVLKKLGRLDEAIEALRQAVLLKPNFATALLMLGIALSDKGDHVEAEAVLRNTLRIQPSFLLAKQTLGAVLNDLDRPKESEIVLRQALMAQASNPRQFAALEHNLGVSLSLQHRYEEAITLFDSAQAKVSEMPYVDYNRANALQNLGHLEMAADCYKKAIIRNPLDTLAHRDLNHILYRLADDDTFLTSYDSAMATYPRVGALPLAKANFLLSKGDYEAAREYFERAALMLPNHVSPHDGLGLVHARMAEYSSAIREHEIALKMEPDNAHVWRNFAETLVRAGDPARALVAAERSLAIEPDHQGTLALWGTALNVLDDPRGEYLNDYESFVQEFEITPPPGHRNIFSFNEELNAYFDVLHRDKREVIDQTLRGGTQTLENLFGRGHKLVDEIQVQIDAAVSAYIGRLKENPVHPLLKRRSSAFKYSGSWSSRLHDCGYHTNHFHPKGWISSAYYVSVPTEVEDSSAKQGWIKFGEPAFDAGLKNPIRRTIKPQPGTLILFPSYMWHGTVPFHSGHSRTTVAFDVVPK